MNSLVLPEETIMQLELKKEEVNNHWRKSNSEMIEERVS